MASLDANIATLIEKGIVASAYGNLLGLVTESIEEDRVCVRLPYGSEITTLGEMVHGGAIASLIDVAATAAAWACPRATLAGRGSTVSLTLNYLAPGLGCDLVADARVIQRGRSICVLEVAVSDPEQTAVARALVTYRLSLPEPELAAGEPNGRSAA